MGHFANNGPHTVVEHALRFVEGAYLDAVVAVHPIFDPEEKAVFRVDIPFQNP